MTTIVALALVAAVAAGGGVTAVVLLRIRRRCPRCHHRGLVPGGVTGDARHKRVVCVRCKAEFAHIDSGYVPLAGTVVLPEAKLHDEAKS